MILDSSVVVSFNQREPLCPNLLGCQKGICRLNQFHSEAHADFDCWMISYAAIAWNRSNSLYSLYGSNADVERMLKQVTQRIK